MEEVKKVLSRLLSTETELENAAQRLALLLHKSSTNGTLSQVQEQAFQMSLVKTLLGIVGSSDCPSLLTQCVRCLALLVHGNDTARVWLGDMNAISLLVDLLSPRSLRGSDKCWHSEWVGVYSQVLIALRKLTYLNEDNQQNLALIGGVKLILTMVNNDNFLTNFNRFPAEAKAELESLVLEQTLVSNVEPATDDQKLSIMAHFSAFRHQGSVPVSYYPVFNVTPLDSCNNPIIAALLNKGVAWSDSSPSPSETKLTRLRVTCVEDGGHLWCQFVSEKQTEVLVVISETLSKLPPLAQDVSIPPLIPGDVYAAYLDSKQWVRAKMLSLETANDKETSSATVLAIDYGYCLTIPNNCLQALPPKCRGIPPQAIPCKLIGVQPPPASLIIIENIAAVLRNMAFDMLIFRKEIMNFRGTETLLKMLQYPHKPTVMQALGALLNMSVSPELREEMGRRGAVHGLLDMSRDVSALETDVLEQVVCCLYNIVLDCDANVSLLRKSGGGHVLADLPAKQLSHNVCECLNKLVQMLSTSRVSKERKPPMGSVCQVLDSDEESECAGVGCEPCDGVKGGASDDVSSSHQANNSKVYSVNRLLPGCPQENNTRSFLNVNSVDDITASIMRRTVCAFANSGKECTLHIGVEKGGIVRGVKIKRKERDLLSIAADILMSDFTPKIYPSQYSIQFVPVVDKAQRCLADVFVMELTVKESVHHQVYTVREKNEHDNSVDRCYYRFDSFNEVLTCQELRDVVARREAERCQRELDAITKNIARLKTAINTHTH